MYKKYIEAYNKCKIIESENGFIGYNKNEMSDKSGVYYMITDLYIKPEARKNGEGLAMVLTVINKAVKDDSEFVCCQVEKKNPMVNKILIGLLKIDFQLYDSDNSTHYLSRSLRNGK